MHLDDMYTAGLFDGEGWFQIDRSTAKDTRRGVSYQVHARICMRDSLIVEALRETYGGSFRQSTKATDRHAAYFTWDICGENVIAFVERVGAHLLIKQKQGALALAFQTLKKENKNGPCSDNRFAALTSMYDEMKVLNKKGVSR